MSRLGYYISGLILIIATGCGTMEKKEAEEQPTEVQTAPEVAAPAGEVAPQPSEPAAEAPQPPRTAQSTPRTQAAAPPSPAPAPVPAPAPAPAAPAAPPPAPEPEPAAAAPPAPEPQYAALTGGTVIPVRLQDALSSGVNQSGETFRARVDQDLLAGNRVVVPRGSIVEGKLTFVEKSGRVQGRAAMAMQLISLEAGGNSYPIETEILSFEAEASQKKDATKVGIGAGLGALIGAIAGGGKGAAIGAAAGAGAGTATVLATRGDELEFQPEHPLDFTLTRDISIRIQ